MREHLLYSTVKYFTRCVAHVATADCSNLAVYSTAPSANGQVLWCQSGMGYWKSQSAAHTACQTAGAVLAEITDSTLLTAISNAASTSVCTLYCSSQISAPTRFAYSWQPMDRTGRAGRRKCIHQVELELADIHHARDRRVGARQANEFLQYCCLYK